MKGHKVPYIPVSSERQLPHMPIQFPDGSQLEYMGEKGGILKPMPIVPPEPPTEPSEPLFVRKVISYEEVPTSATQPQVIVTPNPPLQISGTPNPPIQMSGTPNPPLKTPLSNLKLLIFKISIIAIYVTMVIMQIACLGSSGWTSYDAKLADLSKSDGLIKASSLIMILTGVLSLLSNVALTALMVWGLLSRGKNMYSHFRRVLPVSVFPWIIGVVIQVAASVVLRYGLGSTDRFAIAVIALLVLSTIYADWANNKLARDAAARLENLYPR